MNAEQLAAVLLIVVPVAFNGAFFALARAFDYPDILRREPDEILRRFAAGGPGLLLRWELLLLSALAMLPLAAVLAAVLAAPPALSALAVVLGVSAALVQALGLVRWPYGVSELARRYVAAPAGPRATRPARRWSSPSRRSTACWASAGEHLGYLLTGLWTLAVAASILVTPIIPAWMGFIESRSAPRSSSASSSSPAPTSRTDGRLPARWCPSPISRGRCGSSRSGS